jgi:hypothetical protein
MTPNPYHDRKKYHMAKLIGDGGVSPLCAKTPRKINLHRESWTTHKKMVTCKQCLALMDRKTE